MTGPPVFYVYTTHLGVIRQFIDDEIVLFISLWSVLRRCLWEGHVIVIYTAGIGAITDGEILHLTIHIKIWTLGVKSGDNDARLKLILWNYFWHYEKGEN